MNMHKSATPARCYCKAHEGRTTHSKDCALPLSDSERLLRATTDVAHGNAVLRAQASRLSSFVMRLEDRAAVRRRP